MSELIRTSNLLSCKEAYEQAWDSQTLQES